MTFTRQQSRSPHGAQRGTIHLATPTPRAHCGALPVYWTNDIQAVTCAACLDAIELQAP